MKKLLALMLLCGAAHAQQNVILDAKGNAYMYTFRTGNQVIYTDAKGTPIAYSVPTVASRPDPAWSNQYPTGSRNLPVLLEPTVASGPSLPNPFQIDYSVIQ